MDEAGFTVRKMLPNAFFYEEFDWMTDNPTCLWSCSKEALRYCPNPNSWPTNFIFANNHHKSKADVTTALDTFTDFTSQLLIYLFSLYQPPFSMTCSSTTNSKPMLPSLYFADSKSPTPDSASATAELPSEILSHCLSFSSWGDLAKLACVQKTWSTMLTDAAKHSPEAKWELAESLLNGTNGLAKNPTRALLLLKELTGLSTDENDLPQTPVSIVQNESTPKTGYFAPAMIQLAECYFEGNGVDQLPHTGLAWLEASFEYGDDVNAAHEIALLYEYGRNGIDVDVVAAFEWFTKAATAGHVEAMAELGLCYELGCGVEQSDESALDWYTQAANLGHVTAKFSVGEAFEEARGVPQSDQEACLWYYRAALTGDEDSKKALRRLYDIARIVVPGVALILNE